MRSAALLLGLALAGCRLYVPELRDCAVRCGPADLCPRDTFCSDGFCRPAGAEGACACAPGEVMACPAVNGCVVPDRVCTARGDWGPCVTPAPARELCNGVDDDCDGVVDDDVADALPCPLHRGVCDGAREGCAAGVRVACTAASYGPDFEPAEMSCDGLDNDCDGVVDGRAWVPHDPAGAITLLPHPTGLQRITFADGGAYVGVLGEDLEAEAAAFVPGPWTHATRLRGQLVLGGIVDGGVRLAGPAEVLLDTAAPVVALALGGDAVALTAGGAVLLSRWQPDGGLDAPRFLGADDGGALALTPEGELLAWSGGLLRVGDERELRAGGAGLFALAISELGVVAGVRRVGSAVELVPDVLQGASPVPLFTASSVEPAPVALAFVSGEPVVAWAASGDTWLQRGARRQRVAGGSDAVALAAVPGELVVFARAADAGTWVGAWCPP